MWDCNHTLKLSLYTTRCPLHRSDTRCIFHWWPCRSFLNPQKQNAFKMSPRRIWEMKIACLNLIMPIFSDHCIWELAAHEERLVSTVRSTSSTLLIMTVPIAAQQCSHMTYTFSRASMTKAVSSGRKLIQPEEPAFTEFKTFRPVEKLSKRFAEFSTSSLQANLAEVYGLKDP